jgi:hypothetical protein
MLFDWFYTQRAIWTDGRKLPEDPEPRFYGYSIGHWEGDTFVVQSNGFDDRQWLDADGHPNSTDMRLEERYRRVDHDTIEVRMTLTDPTAYTQPWTAELRTGNLVTPGLDAHTVMRRCLCTFGRAKIQGTGERACGRSGSSKAWKRSEVIAKHSFGAGVAAGLLIATVPCWPIIVHISLDMNRMVLWKGPLPNTTGESRVLPVRRYGR